MEELDMSKWEPLKVPVIDASWHQHGEVIPNMQIKGRISTPKGIAVHLECDACDTNFFAQLWENGLNTSILDNALHAKCPACGCKWDGTTRLFFMVALTNTHQFIGELSVVDSFEAESIFDAMRMVQTGSDPNLTEYGLGTHFLGITFEQVDFRNHVLHKMRADYYRALMREDTRADEIKEETENQYSEWKKKTSLWKKAAKAYSLTQHHPDNTRHFNAVEAFMAAMQGISDVQHEPETQAEEPQPAVS